MSWLKSKYYLIKNKKCGKLRKIGGRNRHSRHYALKNDGSISFEDLEEFRDELEGKL